MAALRRVQLVVLAIVAAALLATGAATGANGADPTPNPGAVTRPTCAERYPEEGPAGVDLRLGCIIGEVVGQYGGSVSAGGATPASTYGLALLGILVAGFVAIWLLGRLVRRSAGRRFAPVRPDEWWLCGSCRSVNGAGVVHCYSCGATRPADAGPTLRTDEAPTTSQSFGSTRKRG